MKRLSPLWRRKVRASSLSSRADAPDVDAVVYVTGEKKQKLAAGKFTRCEVVATRDYDLVAAAIGKPW